MSSSQLCSAKGRPGLLHLLSLLGIALVLVNAVEVGQIGTRVDSSKEFLLSPPPTPPNFYLNTLHPASTNGTVDSLTLCYYREIEDFDNSSLNYHHEATVGFYRPQANGYSLLSSVTLMTSESSMVESWQHLEGEVVCEMVSIRSVAVQEGDVIGVCERGSADSLLSLVADATASDGNFTFNGSNSNSRAQLLGMDLRNDTLLNPCEGQGSIPTTIQTDQLRTEDNILLLIFANISTFIGREVEFVTLASTVATQQSTPTTPTTPPASTHTTSTSAGSTERTDEKYTYYVPIIVSVILLLCLIILLSLLVFFCIVMLRRRKQKEHRVNIDTDHNALEIRMLKKKKGGHQRFSSPSSPPVSEAENHASGQHLLKGPVATSEPYALSLPGKKQPIQPPLIAAADAAGKTAEDSVKPVRSAPKPPSKAARDKASPQTLQLLPVTMAAEATRASSRSSLPPLKPVDTSHKSPPPDTLHKPPAPLTVSHKPPPLKAVHKPPPLKAVDTSHKPPPLKAVDKPPPLKAVDMSHKPPPLKAVHKPPPLKAVDTSHKPPPLKAPKPVNTMHKPPPPKAPKPVDTTHKSPPLKNPRPLDTTHCKSPAPKAPKPVDMTHKSPPPTTPAPTDPDCGVTEQGSDDETADGYTKPWVIPDPMSPFGDPFTSEGGREQSFDISLVQNSAYAGADGINEY